MESSRIPIHGSMTRPANPSEGLAEMKAGRINWEDGNLTVTAATEEFTANCPTTGQPDFYRLTIKYQPEKFYIESKTLKFYLWSFRDQGHHAETLARLIANDIVSAIQPYTVHVTLQQSPRGGIGLTAECIIKQ